jgi:flagellar basal-body rod protein FlgB
VRAQDACCDRTVKERRTILGGTSVKLFEQTKIPVLNRALDAYALRHKTIATNLANITTPGYRAKTVAFEDQLASALQTPAFPGTVTHENHIPFGSPSIAGVQPRVEQPAADANLQCDAAASGLNNVDLDQEMAELAKNQIRFRFSTRILGDTFRVLQKSIRGTQ